MGIGRAPERSACAACSGVGLRPPIVTIRGRTQDTDSEVAPYTKVLGRIDAVRSTTGVAECTVLLSSVMAFGVRAQELSLQ